ncbi:hypothetical protein MTO96_049899 [Rhipicephalus appendiculatus]
MSMTTVGGEQHGGPSTSGGTPRSPRSPPTRDPVRARKRHKSGRRRRSRRQRDDGSQDSSSKTTSGKLDASDLSKRSGASFHGGLKKKGADADVSRLSKKSAECDNEGRVEEVLERAHRTHKSPRVGFVQLLCFALLFGTLFLLALFVKKRISREPFSRCTSEGCLHHAQILLAALNMSVDPCEDFHAFVCGSWDRRLAEGPANAAPVYTDRLMVAFAERAIAELQSDLLKIAGPASEDANGTTYLASQFFKSCTRSDSNGDASSRDLYHLEDEASAIQRAAHENAPSVARTDALHDHGTAGRHARLGHQLERELPLRRPARERERSSRHAVPESRKALDQLGALRGARQLRGPRARVRRVHGSEPGSWRRQSPPPFSSGTSLATCSASRDKSRRGGDPNQTWFRLDLFDNPTPWVEAGIWLGLLNKHFSPDLSWSSDHWVVMEDYGLVEGVQRLLAKYSKRELLIGLSWLFVQTHLWVILDLPQLRFRTGASDDATFFSTLKKYSCLEYVQSRFGSLLPFGQTIGALPTRHAALQKTKYLMSSSLPRPAFLDSERREQLFGTFPRMGADFSANFAEASYWFQATRKDRYRLGLYGRRVSSGYTRSFYVYALNSVSFPMALFQPPLYYNRSGMDVLNVGAGSVLAREVARAFDSKGVTLDEEGRGAVWWGSNRSQDYRDRLACDLNATECCSPVQLFPSVPGLEIAFSTFKTSHDQRLPGLEKYTHDQLFFINYCYVLCADSQS